jgi:L-asparaginase II
MLAHALMRGLPTRDYIDFHHPVQESILSAFAELCGVPEAQVELGVDGCSAPNFAVSLRSAALGYARMADPSDLPDERAEACRRIVRAMIANSDMVGGPGRFDTALMAASNGKIMTKAGAEGYQGVALLPGALGPGSPALGIALKISDGDGASRAKVTAVVELLRQLGALNEDQLQQLAAFDTRPLHNWRQLEVGEIRPAFVLEKRFA